MPLARKRRLIGSRSHQRFPTLFEARIEQAGHLIEVEVTDISVRGARIRALVPIASLVVGIRVVLMADGFAAEGIVKRRDDDQYGIYFDYDIEPLKVVRRNYRPPVPADRGTVHCEP